jgi:DNA-binding beta-propeller fold protein YncE
MEFTSNHRFERLMTPVLRERGVTMDSRAFVVFVTLLACDSSPATTEDPGDFVLGIRDNPACALACDLTCMESTQPWVCPALADWSAVPHDPTACGGFDGTTQPAVTTGACVATDPAGSALAKAQITATPMILPDGRRLQPAGNELVFETDGGFPAAQIWIPNTRFLAINDNGYKTQSIRIVDTALLKANLPGAEVSRIAYPPPSGVNFGLAYLPGKKLLFASSDSGTASVLAFDLDETTGKITADAAKNIALPPGTLASALDISADGKTMLVGQSLGSSIFVVSVDDATYGTVLATIDAGAKDLFALHFDPYDVTGNTAYATMWTSALDFSDTSKMRLLQIDVAGRSTKVIPVGKSPEELVFLDARWALVANALSETLSVLDRAAGQVVSTVTVSTLNGPSPSSLAFDPALSRLYVTLAGDNALGVYDVDLKQSPPAISPAGTIPTGWWPTAVSIDATDQTLFALTGRGHGIGLAAEYDDAGAANRLAGSIQAIAPPDAATLAQYTQTVTSQNAVADLDGYPAVQCNGAPYDFPVPEKPSDGPSTKIKHVFLIVRENKTFDYVMGDRPGLDADPQFVLAPGNMDAIYPNTFAIGAAFSQMDNYYIDAEQSIQGHTWTVFGRSTDYAERRWVNVWGRAQFSVTYQPGVGEETTPAEGNVFEFLSNAGVTVQNMGEFVGGLGSTRDIHWPGGTSDGAIPDTLGACYAAARLRATCDPSQFTYMWLPNDHTHGLAANFPNPALMIATNDEATGMFLDGLSHSPFWKDSLVVVIEDDPADGSDHVDAHRSIALFASPWVKRNYVSHAHYHLSSIHKLISDVFGQPYRNDTIQNAPLPLDVFTSTPDYTPFSYVPRRWTDLSCNPSGSSGSKAAEHWDFTEPDNQPGLDRQVWEALHALPRPR